MARRPVYETPRAVMELASSPKAEEQSDADAVQKLEQNILALNSNVVIQPVEENLPHYDSEQSELA